MQLPFHLVSLFIYKENERINKQIPIKDLFSKDFQAFRCRSFLKKEY